MMTTRPIRIHVASGIPEAVALALRADPGLFAAEPDEADVWIVSGDVPPPVTDARVALLLVGGPDGQTSADAIVAAPLHIVQQALIVGLERRLSSTEAECRRTEAEHRRFHGAMSRFVSVLSHDLRSPLFAIQLGVKVLERQGGTSPSLVVLNRAVGSATDLLSRVVEAGRAVLDPPKRITGTTDLNQVWTRVSTELAAQHPTARITGAPPGPLPVAIDAAGLETLLRTLLGNAVVYGPAASPVEVDFTVDASRVHTRITNTGTLPFSRLDALEPFEHRSSGGLGASLFAARNIATAAGGELDLVQRDSRVEATLGLARAR